MLIALPRGVAFVHQPELTHESDFKGACIGEQQSQLALINFSVRLSCNAQVNR